MDVEIECRSCSGTGLYRGFAEPSGVAVVCLNCGGSGCSRFTFVAFTGRKPRQDVQTVRRSAGNFIATGVGPIGGTVTYAEFIQGKLPS